MLTGNIQGHGGSEREGLWNESSRKAGRNSHDRVGSPGDKERPPYQERTTVMIEDTIKFLHGSAVICRIRFICS